MTCDTSYIYLLDCISQGSQAAFIVAVAWDVWVHHQFLVPTWSIRFHVPFTFTLVGGFCGNIYRIINDYLFHSPRGHLHIFYLSSNQTRPFYLWQVTVTLVSDDDPLVFHGEGWGRRKLDAEQFAAENVLMKLPEVCQMLVIFVGCLRKVNSPCCNWPAKNLVGRRKD